MYAGIGDWGRSTAVNTTLHVVPLPSDSVQQRTMARESWPWMALECLRHKPVPWPKQSNIFSLGYVSKEILNLIDVPMTSPKRAFVYHIQSFFTMVMDILLESRPTAYEFVICMAKAQTYGLDISRNSGL